MRTHSSGDHGNQEPWSFGEEALSIVRSFINLRYQLLPYLYTTFYQYVKRGTPMLRPISFLDIHDPDTYYREDEFMIGDRLLVCPVLQAGAEGRKIYLPEGPWYSLWDDSIVEGKKEVWVKCGLHQIPLFVKPGSVIPMYPTQQYVGEKKSRNWIYMYTIPPDVKKTFSMKIVGMDTIINKAISMKRFSK